MVEPDLRDDDAGFLAGDAGLTYNKTTDTLTQSVTLPTGCASYNFNSQNQIYVTYIIGAAATPYSTVNGPGDGVVDVFDLNGAFVSRVATGANLPARESAAQPDIQSPAPIQTSAAASRARVTTPSLAPPAARASARSARRAGSGAG